MVELEQLSDSHVLLVEGINDYHVVNHIRELEGVPEFQIKDMGGVDSLVDLNAIEASILTRRIRNLGVLVNADANPESR